MDKIILVLWGIVIGIFISAITIFLCLHFNKEGFIRFITR
jgi:tetrahydromethanopterin S-methyltransferase subunit G